jgi:hypothetical protein
MTEAARGPRLATVAGLLAGATGIAIMGTLGVNVPFDRIVLLLGGALIVGLVRTRWATGVGVVLGLLVTVGFLVSDTGMTNLTGQQGVGVAIGQGIQVAGVLVVLVAGVIATRANYRE